MPTVTRKRTAASYAAAVKSREKSELKYANSPIFKHLRGFTLAQASVIIITFAQFVTALAWFREYALPLLTHHGVFALGTVVNLYYTMFDVRVRVALKRATPSGAWDITLGRRWGNVMLRAASGIFPRDAPPFVRNGRTSGCEPHLAFRNLEKPLSAPPSTVAHTIARKLDGLLAESIQAVGEKEDDRTQLVAFWLYARDWLVGFRDGPVALDREAVEMMDTSISGNREYAPSPELQPPPSIISSSTSARGLFAPSDSAPSLLTESDSIPSLITVSDSSAPTSCHPSNLPPPTSNLIPASEIHNGMSSRMSSRWYITGSTLDPEAPVFDPRRPVAMISSASSSDSLASNILAQALESRPKMKKGLPTCPICGIRGHLRYMCKSAQVNMSAGPGVAKDSAGEQVEREKETDANRWLRHLVFTPAPMGLANNGPALFNKTHEKVSDPRRRPSSTTYMDTVVIPPTPPLKASSSLNASITNRPPVHGSEANPELHYPRSETPRFSE
jgi:hypothetical protein